MPADCADILVSHRIPIQAIWETEASGFSPLEGFARRTNISFRRPSRREITAALNNLIEPTVVLSINNNYLFPQQVCEKDNLRIVNFHNSLLPRYPGRNIPTWVIFNGETRHGVTWHLVDTGIDAGNIMCQKEFDISNRDTALKVMMRCISLGIELFTGHWQGFIDHQYKGSPQQHMDDRLYRSTDLPNGGYLDISWDFTTISRFLRSMDYGPFKIVPSPKVRLDSKLYIVAKHTISKDTEIAEKGFQMRKSAGRKGDEVEISYEEGTIKLELREEDSND